MKKLAIVVAIVASAINIFASEMVEMLAYARENGDGGMRLAWRSDSTQEWTKIGTFVNSDFGPWGSHKKMYMPYLAKDGNGLWSATWIADKEGNVVATATTADLMYWKPQTYAISAAERGDVREYDVFGKKAYGNIVKVDKSLIEGLMSYVADRKHKDELYAEQMKDDYERFSTLKPLTLKMRPLPQQRKKISDKLMGIFFEDINYAADGGLYAELIQNRDFEYSPSDRGGDKKWNALTAWSFPAVEKGTYEVRTDSPLHPNNLHYLAIDAKNGFKIVNGGYDGIAVKKDGKYDFSIAMRGNGKIRVELEDANGKVIAKKDIKAKGIDWRSYSGEMRCNATADSARLVITALGDVKADVDMVSLFPQATFKCRKNGLRADLAQMLADLKPKFIRFPGGCVAHGDGIDNIYDWKGSIGALEERKPLRNIWGYHQTRGLGYFEFFQFCEDIGAQPLPVLAAGVPCQNSGTHSHHSHDAITALGQQCGIPMDEMDAYVQDVLDLIEYANGDVNTTWGAKRAEAGHPEPFNLKMIGIGNEDMITEVFESRYKMIVDAVREKYPEIEIVGTVGPFYEGTDYVEGWRLADEMDLPCVDEHYYVQPGWMIYNQDFYDDYKRGATTVYLGEYAAHLPNRQSNIETALAEALYLTSVERNADVVEMTSYAPLLSKDKHTQWRPDLIYFNNTEIRPTVDYYVQKCFGENSGDEYIPAEMLLSSTDAKVNARVGCSTVYDSATGAYIFKLANLLPMSVDADIDISGMNVSADDEATVEGIVGNPADTKCAQFSFDIPVSDSIKYVLPPYSFSILRVRACGTGSK